MPAPFGNEYISLFDRRALLVWWLGWMLLIPLLLWVNLARVAAGVWPTWGGPVISLGRLGAIWTLGKILFNLRAAVDLGRPAIITHQWSPLHLWWVQWWQSAQPYLIGGPRVDRVVAANVALGLFILLGFGLWSRSIRVGRPPDARPGTSHWAPSDKLRPYVKAVGTPGSLPLGRIRQPAGGAGTPIALPPLRRFAHVGVWGVTEAGKTSGIFKPWLLTDALLNDPSVPFGAMSSVAIDIKHPDLYDTLAPYIAPLPRRFVLLAPSSPEVSMSYNALDHLDPLDVEAYKSDVDALAYAIVENTVFAHKDVPYYRAIETRLLQLLIQFAVEAEGHLPQEDLEPLTRHLLRGQSLPPVRSFPFLALLAALGHRDFLQLIEATITDPARPDLWRARFAQFHDMSGHDLTGVLHGLQRRLAAFTAPDIARVSTHSHRVRLDTLGRQPTTLIVGMQTVNPETIQTYAALIITQLIQQLVRLADRSPGRRLPVPVTIYLDEISNTARIPAIEDNIATLRDNGIAFVLGLQDDSGLQQRYGEEAARKIVANLNTKIVLGRNLHIAQAIETARLAGETTILTHSASAGDRGSSENQHPVRRGLMTPDQIRRMEQYEALVFLQEGVITKTRLFPFPPRDPATGRWMPIHGSRREQVLYDQLRRDLHKLTFDRQMARPPHTSRRFIAGETGNSVLPQAWPIHRLRQRDLMLDKTLGPLALSDASSPPPESLVSAGEPVKMPDPPGATERPEGPPGDQAKQAPPIDASGDDPISPAEPQETSSDEPRPVRASEALTNGAVKIRSPESSREEQAPDVNALGEMTGFFRSIIHGKITVPECEHGGAPAGWRLALAEGPYVLVRHSFALAYGDRRRTRPQDIIDRWQRAGLVASSRVNVTAETPHVRVLAFTPVAVARFIPAIRDEISMWRELSPHHLLGLSISPAQTARAANVPLPSDPSSVPPPRTGFPPLNDNPDKALAAIIAWIQANKAALCIPMGSNLGQWEATSHGGPVLLVRTNHAMRTLISRHFDARAVLIAWRDRGTIITRPNRFTLYMRAEDDEKRSRRKGTTFVAFAWDALEKAGLRRNASIP